MCIRRTWRARSAARAASLSSSRSRGGHTRLVGRTWYKLEFAPHAYWTIWTDWIIHRIHGRVLEHIKTLAERHA